MFGGIDDKFFMFIILYQRHRRIQKCLRMCPLNGKDIARSIVNYFENINLKKNNQRFLLILVELLVHFVNPKLNVSFNF